MTEQMQGTDALRTAERFAVTQQITLAVNRYDIRALGADGEMGAVLATAQQKRLALKEQVTFYADEARTRPVFSFRARKRLDLGSGYDVVDADGAALGSFRKDFGTSLLRSTWHLEAPGLASTGSERNATVAGLRRVWNLVPVVGELPAPFVVHFDFVDGDDQPVLTSTRRISVRDRYDVTVPGGRVDGRLAAAMAVALDALQSR
jgi:uncharacterized protein YxjI